MRQMESPKGSAGDLRGQKCRAGKGVVRGHARGGGHAEDNKKTAPYHMALSFVGSRRLPIFPGRLQPSIVGV